MPLYSVREMKLCIAGREFATKKTAKLYIVALVQSLIGCEVHESSEHFKLLMSLWLRSPSYVPGECHFVVGTKISGVAIKTVNRCGELIDWSLRAAIAGRDVSAWGKLTAALRSSIRPAIQKFRSEGSGKCVLCNVSGFCEVDHHMVRFRDLMRAYLEERGYYPDNYVYTHSGWSFTEADREFEQRWVRFHEEKCSLRLLCSPCHKVVTQQQKGLSECSE